MTLLHLAAYPPDQGGGSQTYGAGLLQALRLALPDLPVESLHPPPLRRSARGHRLRQIRALALARISPLPAKILFAPLASLRRRLTQRLAQGPAPRLILLDGVDALALMDLLPAGVPRVAVLHNLEHQVLREQVARAGRLARPILGTLFREPDRLERFEQRMLGQVQAALCISAEDAAGVAGWIPGLPVAAVPPVFGAEPPARRSHPGGNRLRLSFLGKHGWWPNREGIGWFLDEVWDEARRSATTPLDLTLIGQGSEAFADAGRGIRALGFVPDLRSVWEGTDIMLVPIFSGGGVNVKLCEALWQGVPVLTTRRGLRGLAALAEPGILVADSARDWIRILSGPPAAALARASVSDATRARFSSAAAAEVMQSLLRPILG